MPTRAGACAGSASARARSCQWLPGVLLRFGAAGGATAAYNPGPVPIRKGHWKTGPGENASGSRN